MNHRKATSLLFPGFLSSYACELPRKNRSEGQKQNFKNGQRLTPKAKS